MCRNLTDRRTNQSTCLALWVIVGRLISVYDLMRKADWRGHYFTLNFLIHWITLIDVEARKTKISEDLHYSFE